MSVHMCVHAQKSLETYAKTIVFGYPTGTCNMQVYVMTHERMTSCGMIMNVLVLSDHRSPSKSLDFEPPPPPLPPKKRRKIWRIKM